MRWTLAGACLAALVGAAGVVVLSGDWGRDIGAGVTASGDELPGRLRARLAPGKPSLPLRAELITPVSDVYEIAPAGPLPGTVEFTLPLAGAYRPDDGHLLLALTAAAPEGPWQPVLRRDARGMVTAEPAVRLAADGRSATLATDHLSFFTFVKVKIGQLANVVRDAAGQFIGGVTDLLNLMAEAFHGLTADVFAEARRPACADQEEAREDSYTMVADAKDTVLHCFGVEDGTRVLKVVNNRRYPLLLDHNRLTVINDNPGLKFRLAHLAKALSGPDIVLFPREEAIFGVSLPDSGGTARLATSIDGNAQNLYTLEVALRLALLFLTNFGAGTGVAANGAIKGEIPIVDLMDKALQVTDCATIVAEQGPIDAGEVLHRCASPATLLEVFGVAAVLLAPIMVVAPLVAFFRSQLNAIGDQFNARDEQTITITRADVTTLCPTGQDNCAGIRQADVDGDGQLDQVSLVTDPAYGDCRQFQAHVVFAKGGTANGDFCFGRAGMLGDTVGFNQLSFLGFSDIDGLPGQEVFAKVNTYSDDPFYADGRYNVWQAGALRYLGEDRLDVVQIDPGRMPMHLYDTGINHWSAQGFRCATAASGERRLIVWSVAVTDNRANGVHEYGVTESAYRPHPVTAVWEQVPGEFHEEEHPLTDRSAPRRIVAEKSQTNCPGLDSLPTPDYYW